MCPSHGKDVHVIAMGEGRRGEACVIVTQPQGSCAWYDTEKL